MCPGSPGPHPLDNFFVRFHYYGSFQQVDKKLDYVGELVAEMFIPRDNLSYTELCNYAEDIHQVERGHCRGTYTYKLHWLPPGKKVSDGRLMFLSDDESVKRMDVGIIDGYADVFVEELDMPIQQQIDSDKESEMHQDQTVLSASNEQFDICAGDEYIDICAGLLSVNVGETYSRHRGTNYHLLVCKSSQQLDAYIAQCYSIETYKKIYSHVLEPLEGQSNWPIADHVRPQAPSYIKMSGRPRKERRREEGEAPKGTKMSKVGGQITCSSCNRKGHNMTSCKNNATATKHRGNAHIVRERSRKRKLQKQAYEAENSKKSKGMY